MPSVESFVFSTRQPEELRLWYRHCALLVERVRAVRDPVAIARLHHQRGFVLHQLLGDTPGAIRAWLEALEAWQGHVPSLVALRDAALATDDLPLARRVFDGHLDALNRPGADPGDSAEMYTFFAWAWLLRWPDEERAAQAVRRLDAVAPDGDGDVLAPLALPRASLALRLERRIEAGVRGDHLRMLADLRTRAARMGEGNVRPLFVEAAARDAYAALRWVEEATALDDVLGQAEGMEALARFCGAYKPVLRFLAGELWDLLLDDGGRASAAFAETAEVAVDRVIRVKEGIRRARRVVDPAVLADALESLGAQAPEDAVFSACLLLRAASLRAEAGEVERAWLLAADAVRRFSDLPAAGPLLARLGIAARRWRPLAEALAPLSGAGWRRLRAAVLELGAGDTVAAEAALGRVDAATDRAELRLRQRLLTVAGDPAVSRAWQREAALLNDGDRRADLYLRIGHHYLREAGSLDKALTYLFWVLDQEGEHLTALRLLFEACRSTGRREPLLEVAGRLLTLLSEPADRLPVQRAVAEAWTEADPLRAAAIYEQIRAVHPGDPETLRALEALYERLDRAADLIRVLQEALRTGALPGPEQGRVALRLGRLLESQDPGGAQRVYADAIERAVPGSAVHQALEAGIARLLGQEDPTATLYATSNSVNVRPSETAPPRTAGTGLTSPDDTRAPAPRGEAPPLPRLTPLPTLRRPGERDDGLGAALLAPFGEEEEEPATLTDHAVMGGPVETEGAGFLGDERTRGREEDPGRAVVARKLRQARREEAWPDLGQREIRLLISTLENAEDPDQRVEAASALGERYLAAGEPAAALRALRVARGFGADDPRLEARLEAVLTTLADWAGLADLLAARLRRLPPRDTERRRALLVQLGRLRAGPLDDPARAVDAFQEAFTLGERSPAVAAELANVLKAVRRYREYVEVLTAAGLADPDVVSPADALTLGRVFLYRMDAPERAAPFILRAARAMPDRVDVAADLAWARAASGEVRQGVRLLEQAIAAAAGPEGQAARQVLRLRLARLYEELAADAELARRAYREALRDGVRDPAVLERVERMATDARDGVTLAEVLRRAFEEAQARRDGAELRKLGLRLGRLLRELDQPQEATRVLLETYEHVPEDEELFRAVVEGLRLHPDGPATIRLYGTRVAAGLLAPGERLEAGLALVRAFETEGRVEEAAEELSALRALAPDDPGVLQALERVYPRAGRWPVLVALYRSEAAAADEATLPTVLRKLARALEVGVRDLPAATEVWQALVARDLRDLDAVRAVARLLEAQKRWSELLLVSQREVALVTDPRQKAYIHFRIGTLHETHSSNLEAASAAYRTALKLDPRCFPALHGLRTIATDQGDWPRVLHLLEVELGLWDDARERAAVLARMGDVQARHLGQPAEGDASYRRAVELWPGCVPAARALADAAFQAGRYAEAAPLLQGLTQQKLDAWPPVARSDLFYKRGAAAFHLGRVMEAIESLDLALEFVPDHYEALRVLVKAVARVGDPDRLEGLMARLDGVHRAHAEAGRAVDLARIDILRGHVAQRTLQLDQAAAFYQAAALRRPRDLESHRPLVMLHVRARRWSEATGVLRRFAEGLKAASPDNAQDRARYVEALLLEADLWCDGAADPGKAIDCCRRVLQVEPNARNALFSMAQAHFLKQEYAEARDVMHRLLSRPAAEPAEHALHIFYQGRIQEVGFQDVAAASETYQRALQIDPRCASALLGLLRLAGRQREGVVPQLLETYRHLLEGPDGGDPAVGALRIHVAGLRLRRGDHEGARTLLAPLADGGGPRARDARFALVQVATARNAPEDAVRPLYRILDEDVSDSEALRALAEILARRGDNERLFQVLSALELLGALPPEEGRFEGLAARARLAGDRAGRPLTPDELHRLVAHPSYHSPLLSLAALCEPALAERFPVVVHDAPRRSARAVESDLRRTVQALLGWRDFELHAVEATDLIRVRPGERPTLLLGAQLSTAHQRFLVARAAAFGRAGLARLHDLGPERSLEMLTTLGAFFDRHGDATLLAALPPKTGDAAQTLITAAGGAPLPAMHTGEAVLTGLVRTADRVGLLAAGRLRPALEAIIIAATPGDAPRLGDLTWAVRSRSRLQDLVKYALSDAFHQARQALGLAL